MKTKLGIEYADGVADGLSAEVSMNCMTEYVVEHTTLPRLFCAVNSPAEADEFVQNTIGSVIKHSSGHIKNKIEDWRLIRTGYGCQEIIKSAARTLGARGGSSKTDAKAKAARANGKKGGRPAGPAWVHGKVAVGRELSYRIPGGKHVSLGKILEIRKSASRAKGLVAVCEKGEHGINMRVGRVYTR